MPMRHATAQAHAPRRPAVEPSHLGGGPRLIDENQAGGLEVELPLEPGASAPQDVRTVLLRRVRVLFLRVIRRRAKKRHRVESADATPRPARSSRSSASVMSGVVSTAPGSQARAPLSDASACRRPAARDAPTPAAAPATSSGSRWRCSPQTAPPPCGGSSRRPPPPPPAPAGPPTSACPSPAGLLTSRHGESDSRPHGNPHPSHTGRELL